MAKLGINLDHVATVRQARKTFEPKPLEAAFIAQKAGAHGITLHLREDRRHIQNEDVLDIKRLIQLPLNLEMALSDEIIDFAEKLKPYSVTIVPEKREELTTEGGLDVIKNFSKIEKMIKKFDKLGIIVSLFIDPETKQIDSSFKTGARVIELHTGDYADALNIKEKALELKRLEKAAKYAKELKITVNAGHGLNYYNVKDLVKTIPFLHELNIGHSIVSRAVLYGMETAVIEMMNLIEI